MPRRPLALAVPLVVLLALAVLASPAAASPTMDVGFADDRVLQDAAEDEARAVVARWKALGVDTVRITAQWIEFVAGPNDRRVPPRFDRSDPDSPGYHWAKLDRAVGLVRDAGMRPMLMITGKGPLWSSTDTRRGTGNFKPSVTEYRRYATAVARRYARDVREYILWNEPNLTLQPQNACRRSGRRRRCTPYAPHLYRRLVRAAEPAIRAADTDARILLGSLAPRGERIRGRNTRLRPLVFIRELGCVTRRYQRKRSGRCRGFRPASGHGFAYHPHGTRMRPTQRSPNRDDAQIGDLRRLISALDRVTRRGGLRARTSSRRLPLYLDEYGYETLPSDRVRGVSPARQSLFLQQGAYIAWRNRRVVNITQYVWQDEPVRRPAFAGWQSGLLTSSGRPKPALATFPVPFWAERRSRGVVRLWGQVRPGASTTVDVQRRRGGGWRTLRRVRTSSRGFFIVNVRTRSRGTYRYTAPGVPEALVSSSRTVR